MAEAVRRVWKYPLGAPSGPGRAKISMPRGSEVVASGPNPEGGFCMWAVVCPDAEIVEREVLIVGTGEPLPPGCDRSCWITTFVGPELVWHLFILPDPPRLAN